MAGYDPQRTRPRPSVAADAPAPVDALLATAVEPVASADPSVTELAPSPTPTVEHTSAPAQREAPAVPSGAEVVPSAPYVPTVPSAAQRSRSRLIMLAAGSTLAVVLLIVLRRRRRS